MTVVKFVSGEVVGGIQPDAAGTEFGKEFSLFAGKALELGFGRFTDREADEEVPKQG
jgi:hypothetical protein